jgi:hypothetical protein
MKHSRDSNIFPEREWRITSGMRRMTFSGLRYGMRSEGLERNEIEEGTVPFSLY